MDNKQNDINTELKQNAQFIQPAEYGTGQTAAVDIMHDKLLKNEVGEDPQNLSTLDANNTSKINLLEA